MSNINKGGRPIKDHKRTKEKRILLTEVEVKQLDTLFSESDYSNMNSMIRDILLNKQYRIFTFDNELRIQRNILIEEVRRIGNNFNQLMRSFNQRKMDSFSKNEIDLLLKNLAEIKDVFFKIEEIAKKDYK